MIIVDVQNDFCPGGSLAVSDGDKIIPVINRLSASKIFDCVVATQDWHPADHMSFASTYGTEPYEMNDKAGQIVWPDHCEQGTRGAEFRPSVNLNPVDCIIRKGTNPDVDSYSAFFDNEKKNDTGLFGLLKSKCPSNEKIEIYICGIATDVCVLNTAADAIQLNAGGSVFVIRDACAGVTPDGVKSAISKMESGGIKIINSSEILNT